LNVVQKVLTGGCLEHTPGSLPVGWCVLGHLEHDRQPCLDRVDHPGGHVGGGVPVAGADPAAAVQLAAAAALVAHQLVNHAGGDAGVLQPGREGVAEVMGPAQVQVVEVGATDSGAAW
jgi:hypothetical protein